jgi:hypothetical protein
MAATAILTTRIAEAAVIIAAEFIVAVPSSEVALSSGAAQDIEGPTLLTIVPSGAVANLNRVRKIEMSALGCGQLAVDMSQKGK